MLCNFINIHQWPSHRRYVSGLRYKERPQPRDISYVLCRLHSNRPKEPSQQHNSIQNFQTTQQSAPRSDNRHLPDSTTMPCTLHKNMANMSCQPWSLFSDPGCRAVYGVGMKPFGLRDRGFETSWEQWCSSPVCVVLCFYQAAASAPGRSLVQTVLPGVGLIVCDLEPSTMWQPRPQFGLLHHRQNCTLCKYL